jgi:hypothetical protein
MKRIKIGAAVSAMVLVGSLAGSVFAQDGVIEKEDAAEGYCHMKFPAIRQRTLSSDNPQVKSKTTGDVIDFYGDCNESPTSADQVLEQKHQETFMYTNNYESE